MRKWLERRRFNRFMDELGASDWQREITWAYMERFRNTSGENKAQS